MKRPLPPSALLVTLAFLIVLSGRFTLERAGIEAPVFDDPRAAMIFLLVACLVFELGRARPDLVAGKGAPAPLALLLVFLSYQLLSTLWAPDSPRTGKALADVGVLGALAIIYWTLACWDRDRVVAMTLGSCFAAGVLYFAVAASGRGHDPSGRWAALGGGPNVFVRIMIIAAIAAVYFYHRSGRRVLWLAPIPAFVAGALLSGSRGGILTAVIVAGLAVCFALSRLRPARVVQAGFALAGAAGIIWLLAGARLAHVISERFVDLTLRRGYTAGRDVLFQQAWHLFQEHPVAGLGLDGYFAVTHASFGEQYVHSLPLSVAAEGGSIGLILLGLAIGIPAVAYLSIPVHERSLEARTAAYCAIYIGAASLFSGDYYDARLMWVFLLLAAVTPLTVSAGPISLRIQTAR